MKIITVRVDDNPSDETLIDRVRLAPNGDYATSVCRRCGAYATNPFKPHNTPTVIKKRCRHCLTEAEELED